MIAGVLLACWGMRFVQPIVYRGRLVACATRDRLFLSEALERRPAADPELRFVLLMCCYARDVLNGKLPGRYSTQKARRYARAALIPAELLERDLGDLRRAASGLGVPLAELRAARYRCSASRPWSQRA